MSKKKVKFLKLWDVVRDKIEEMGHDPDKLTASHAEHLMLDFIRNGPMVLHGAAFGDATPRPCAWCDETPRFTFKGPESAFTESQRIWIVIARLGHTCERAEHWGAHTFEPTSDSAFKEARAKVVEEWNDMQLHAGPKPKRGPEELRGWA